MAGWQSLKGQQLLKIGLGNLLARHRVSHAVLLTGPAGSGKRTWGRALAQALLCSERAGADPCLSCLSCRQFQSGNHPRFINLEPQGRQLKVQQIREVRPSFYLEGGNTVCLIQQAEKMTAVACSSLLKILEEPPPGLHFILLSAEPGRLFPTILSRCQRFTLLPLSNGEITELLLERTALSHEAAELIARLSGGLPGRALALAGDETFKERLAGAASLVRELARSGGNPRNWLTRAGELAEREDLVSLLELLHLCLRDALILSLCRRNDLLINPGNARLWEDLPASALLEEAVELVSATISDLLTTNVNRRLALESLFLLLQRRLSGCPG
ncbi:MAG: DNA polymerase III subunit [Firmicutes bacterium]|nr:DNA polymerase III subunit [Bacillota bacterium]